MCGKYRVSVLCLDIRKNLFGSINYLSCDLGKLQELLEYHLLTSNGASEKSVNPRLRTGTGLNYESISTCVLL